MLSSAFFNWKGLLLWSNHFYGLCAIILSIESSLILLDTLPSLYVLALIYFSTVAFYSYAYLKETSSGIYDERSRWYNKFNRYLLIRQCFLVLAVIYIAFIKLKIIEVFFSLNLIVQMVLLFSCLLSFLYYFPSTKIKQFKSIRKWGVTKSLSIAWVWSITCCLIPVLLTTQGINTNSFSAVHFLLYIIQLYVFILLLAILFDIKDLARDKEELVHTIVLKYGVEHTIKKFATPLMFFYLFVSCLIYYLFQQTVIYLLSQIMLIVMIYFVIAVIRKVKAVHYNILYIDGLILVKALLGIAYTSFCY